MYDLKSLKLQYLCPYPGDKVWANSMGMAIDNEQHKLHLFGGKGLFGQWLILNLKAKIWDTRKDLSKFAIPFTYNMTNPKCIVIDKCLHVYSKGRFLKYNRIKHHKFVELSSIKGYDVKNIEFMFYVKEQRRIYVFGGSNDDPLNKQYFDDIWYCEHNESFHEYKWHRFNIQLPYHMELDDDTTTMDGNTLRSKYNAVLGFKNILFIFYHEKKEVWCIDLMKEKRYICDKLVSIDGSSRSQLLNTRAKITHSLCMDHNGPIHNILKLNHIIKSTPFI